MKNYFIIASLIFTCLTSLAQEREKYLPDQVKGKRMEVRSDWAKQSWERSYYLDSSSVEPFFKLRESYYSNNRIRKIEISTKFQMPDSTYLWSVDSTVVYYDSITSPIKSVSNYGVKTIFGKENGIKLCYFKNGMLQTKIEYNSIGHIAHTFYMNGQLKSSIRYNRNKIWDVEEYHTYNGENLNYGNLQEGKGLLYVYSDSGELLRIEKYRKGKLKKIIDG